MWLLVGSDVIQATRTSSRLAGRDVCVQNREVEPHHEDLDTQYYSILLLHKGKELGTLRLSIRDC
jgi:hypothetical protein